MYPWVLLLLLVSFLGPAPAPEPVANILQAHGGGQVLNRLSIYEVRGTLEAGEQGPTPFLLKVDGDLSRFEFDGRVFVRQEAVVQWWDDSGRLSDARKGWEGLREAYLLPLHPVRELLLRYQYRGRRANRHDFHRKIERRTHIGYHRKTPLVDLSFHSESGLLAEAVFSTEEANQTPVVTSYADYRLFDGIPLPTTVTRQVGDSSAWVFTIESVDFRPRFSEGDFVFRPKGGVR